MKKQYIFILLFVTHLILGQTPTGTSTEVGITEGQLSVSLSGGANYSIPIAVPPGINGVMPQVGLVYNSQGGNGMAGYGWNISGVSAITRIPRTKFHDGVVGGVNLDANDRFAFDGQRLILKSGTAYGAAGTIYETESFSNLKITAVGVSPLGANYGPASFLVEYPDGSKAEYGATTDSRSITTWGITYWENPQGIRISYNYLLANNNLSIEYIKYGSTSTNTPINQIKFVYVARQRPEQSYVAGQSILMNTILKEIKTIGNGIGFRNYVLDYLSEDITSLGYERLSKITETSGDGSKSYNPTVFSYDTTNNNNLFDVYPPTQIDFSNVNSRNTATVTGDFNGDSKMDIILYPITGSAAKSKYYLFTEISSGNYNQSFTSELASFDEIFPITWLSWNNKLMPMQGWCVVKNNFTTSTTTFKNYTTTAMNPIDLQYEKTYQFPKMSYDYYCGVGVTPENPIPKPIHYEFDIPKGYLSGDFNGDGLTDVVMIEKPMSYLYHECNSSYTVNRPGGQSYFINLDRRLTSNFVNWSGTIDSDANSKFIVADYNGDGKSDIYVFNTGIIKVYSLNDSNFFVLLVTQNDSGIKLDKPLLMGDYNGDGKMDFVIPQQHQSDSWNFYFSTGKDSFKLKNGAIGIAYWDSVCDFTNKFSENYWISGDFNKDGKFDLLLYGVKTALDPGSSNPCNINYNGAPLSNDFVLFENKLVNDQTLSFIYNQTPYHTNYGISRYPIIAMLDFNNHTNTSDFSFITNNKIISLKQPKDSSIDTKLKKIKTANGVTESITYKPIDPSAVEGYNQVYSNSYEANYPNFDIQTASTFQVVSKLEKQSASVYKKQLFSYAGATSNMEGLGFLGFRASMRTNWFEDDSKIISSISKSDPNLRGANVASYTYLGLVAPAIAVNTAAPNTPRTSAITINNTRTATETVLATNSIRFLPGATITPSAGNTFVAKITPDYDANGFAETNSVPPSNLISKSLSFYEASLSATKVYKLQNTQSNTYNILENTSSETVTVYDTYNNPIESISKIRNGGAGEQTTVSTVAYQSPTTSPYAMGRPISKTQTVTSSGDSMTSKETYGYGTGTESNLLKKIEKWGNNTSAITEDNEYDAFGNITKKTITAGPNPRITYYEYTTASPYNGRFLTKSTDIEGLSTTFAYNTNNGLLVSETNPYSLTTSYLYDSWFKKTKTTDYLGKNNNYAYSRINSVNTLVTTTGDDGSYGEEVFDDLGRKITSGVKDISGNTSKVFYLYDIYDRNIKVSEPYIGSGASQWSETQYDVYGRTMENKSFTGKTVTINYQGLTTTVNDGSKTKTSVKNAIGNVVSMTDTPGGTINYTYFANGNLKSTNYAGVITTIEQDGWGRKTKLTDPSAGTYTYAYNGFGETTSETTPNGTTTYTLNAVGKLTAKTISGTNTNSSTIYNYSGTTKLLDSSIFTNTLEGGAVTTNTYSYDSYKRLVGTAEVTPYATFTKTINLFDAFGRVETETTSGTANGKTSSKTIKNTYKNSYAWQILDNVSQQVLWQTNTVNARGQLLTANLGNGIAITNSYDAYGFATQFKHDKTSASVNIMTLSTVFDAQKGNLSSRTNSLFGTTDNFTYDSLDRLTSYPNAQGVIETQTYNEDGRIDVNTLGKYNYTNTAKKYQNTSVTVTPEAKAYYGSKPSPFQQTISYNVFKSPYEIIEAGVDKISFTYNDGNDRSAMFYGNTNTDKNLRPNRKYYSADGSMEIKITPAGTEFVTYIGGDGYSAPIVLKSDGTTQNYLYLHRDYQGTILAITDANATVLEKRLFDAWGAIIKVQDGNGNVLNGLTILDRGYTGHEHLQSVGLINMNGRLYDPKLHRFLQPDNYVQDPSNTQNFNRYGYCWNNPLKYSDESGEWIHLLVGAVVGGVVNWASNGCQFNSAGLGYLGTGAASGFVTALTGNPMLGAAILGAGNSINNQLQNGGKIDPGRLFGDTLTSVVVSGASAGISNYMAPYLDKTLNSVVTNSVIRESVKQSISNAISGFAIGGFLAGIQGGSLNDMSKGAFSGAKSGAAMGAASGLIIGYINVKAKTVSSGDKATKTQTEPTTQKNTVSNMSGSKSPSQFDEYLPSNGLKENYHGNDLRSTKPTWGYKLYDNNGNFLKNGITNKPIPEMRYTKTFMGDKYMDFKIQFPTRIEAYQWEYQQNLIQRGPLNLNMH